VARARHNRDKNHASETALDLLEKYLIEGKNHTQQQKERWGGDYPLTVLGEALNKISPRLGFASVRELMESYPNKIKQKIVLEDIFRDIGLEVIGFKEIRNVIEDFQVKYGLPIPPTPPITPNPTLPSIPSVPTTVATTTPGTQTGIVLPVNAPATPSTPKQPIAISTNDPKHVIRTLKKFTPRGANRGKLMTLLIEARSLNLEKQPHCFCFILRSMFEISAKAYCNDFSTAGLSTQKPNGEEKFLVNVLREITDHLTNKQDKHNPMTKILHGAMTELATSDGILSVTSLNQLVHNPQFVIDSNRIGPIFTNIFPLLQAMNR